MAEAPERLVLPLSLPPLTLSDMCLWQPREYTTVYFELAGKKRMGVYKVRLWSKLSASISILRYIFCSSLFSFFVLHFVLVLLK